MLAIVPALSADFEAATAVSRIRTDLSALEASLDLAMAAAASLAQAMIEARRNSGLPVHTGQTALVRLQRAQAQLVGASSDTFRVHDEMGKLGKTLMMLDDPTPISGLLGDDQNLNVAA